MIPKTIFERPLSTCPRSPGGHGQ
jgi:hypothetical protein